jgi:hypothetical protein
MCACTRTHLDVRVHTHTSRCVHTRANIYTSTGAHTGRVDVCVCIRTHICARTRSAEVCARAYEVCVLCVRCVCVRSVCVVCSVCVLMSTANHWKCRRAYTIRRGVCACVPEQTHNHNHGCTPPAAIEGARACTMRRGVCVCVCEQTHGPRTNARRHARTCARAHTHRSRAGSAGRPGHGVATTLPQRPTHTHTHAHTHTHMCDTSTRTHTHTHTHRSRAGSPGRPGHGVATTLPQRPTHTHTHTRTHTHA